MKDRKGNNLFKYKQNFSKINNDINNKDLFFKEHLFILIIINFWKNLKDDFCQKIIGTCYPLNNDYHPPQMTKPRLLLEISC